MLFHVNGKKAIVVPIYKVGDRSVAGNYRPVSLTSVVLKQMDHFIVRHLRQDEEMSGWLYEGQNCFRARYSRDSQVVTACQDIANSLGEGHRTDAIMDFSKAYEFVHLIGCLPKSRQTKWIWG